MQPILPDQFARGGVETRGDAEVVDRVQATVQVDRRRHVRAASHRAPRQVRLAHVPLAAGPQADRRPVAARCRDQQAAGHDDRRYDFLSRTGERPYLFAARRIVALHGFAAGKHEFIVVANSHNDRRAPGHCSLAMVGPADLACVLVQCDADRFGAVLVVDEDDQVLVEQRARAGAVGRVELHRVVVPEQRAAEVVAHQPARTKERDHSLAVCDRRSGREAVLVAHARFRRGCGGGLRPDGAPILNAQTMDESFGAIGRRAREENAIAPDDRRRVAESGRFAAPRDIRTIFAPLHRQAVEAGQPLAAGSAKPRPVPLGSWRGQCDGQRRVGRGQLASRRAGRLGLLAQVERRRLFVPSIAFAHQVQKPLANLHSSLIRPLQLRVGQHFFLAAVFLCETLRVVLGLNALPFRGEVRRQHLQRDELAILDALDVPREHAELRAERILLVDVRLAERQPHDQQRATEFHMCPGKLGRNEFSRSRASEAAATQLRKTC